MRLRMWLTAGVAVAAGLAGGLAAAAPARADWGDGDGWHHWQERHDWRRPYVYVPPPPVYYAPPPVYYRPPPVYYAPPPPPRVYFRFGY